MINPINNYPSLAVSGGNAIQSGMARMNQAAAEIVAGSGPDTVNVSSPGMAEGNSGAAEPSLIQGIMDSISAQVQVKAGVALLHEYKRTTDELFDLLKPESLTGDTG